MDASKKTVVFWLDNSPRDVAKGVHALRAAGCVVEEFHSEDEVLLALESGNIPTAIIQDLHRPFATSSSQTPVGTAHTSGWRFYEGVLKPQFPQIPILVCSYDANKLHNLQQADDFNLVLVPKSRQLDIVDQVKRK